MAYALIRRYFMREAILPHPLERQNLSLSSSRDFYGEKYNFLFTLKTFRNFKFIFLEIIIFQTYTFRQVI